MYFKENAGNMWNKNEKDTSWRKCPVYFIWLAVHRLSTYFHKRNQCS